MGYLKEYDNRVVGSSPDLSLRQRTRIAESGRNNVLQEDYTN